VAKLKLAVEQIFCLLSLWSKVLHAFARFVESGGHHHAGLILANLIRFSGQSVFNKVQQSPAIFCGQTSHVKILLLHCLPPFGNFTKELDDMIILNGNYYFVNISKSLSVSDLRGFAF